MKNPPHKLALWQFPDGPAQGLDDQKIVLKQSRSGDFRDCYVTNLLDGDYYMIKNPVELPPRTDESILNFIIDNRLKFEYGDDDVYVYRSDQFICDHPYSKETRRDDVRDVAQYIMDMDEL